LFPSPTVPVVRELFHAPVSFAPILTDLAAFFDSFGRGCRQRR